MPKLMDNMMEVKTASNYKFSAVKMDELGATEYTLVTIAVDTSGSVSAYQSELTKCIKTIVESCQKSPRSDYLMVRLVEFNNDLKELHGFKLLSTINTKDYDGLINPSGNTRMIDTVYACIEATKDYGKMLVDQDFTANAIIFVVTDGADNCSSKDSVSVKKMVANTMKAECLESVTVVLVGITDGSGVSNYLDGFQKDADITQYVDIGEASPSKLAKLAKFISQSISSTSQALGSGSGSQLLTF